jgi:hypothetical protein
VAVTLLLVCGDRNWRDRERLFAVLDLYAGILGRVTIVEGGQGWWDARARQVVGADRLAGLWAEDRGQGHETFLADWSRLGGMAGPDRNERMLRRCLDATDDCIGIAFHDHLGRSRGTVDMVGRMVRASLPVDLWRTFEPSPVLLGKPTDPGGRIGGELIL